MGLLRTAGRVAVASSVHGRVQRRQARRWAAQDQTAAPVAPAPALPAPAAAPSASDDVMARKLAMLTQLGELKAAGVLTEAEFEAKKALILAG
ncbi:MAG: SHOCT domain-containing protein [Propionicimonas sp.]